ncbi:autotransporter outer membrane beta-barrel domain-containing protein [Fusobacterium sp. THCT13E1]
MIDKIIKAVKSSNKRRGRNITIGAVVGFLLSCTAVMGADNYLWIKEDNGIKFSIDGNSSGSGESWNEDNPYTDENIWNADTKTYVNNITLSGTDNDASSYTQIGYGLKLEGNLGAFELINNGSMTGTATATGSSASGYGIYNVGTIATLANNGSIAGILTGEGFGIGIYNSNSPRGTIGSLVNNGLITGTSIGSSGNGYGIYNAGTIESLINNSSITGSATGGMMKGIGIYNSGGTIGSLVNNGLITGTATGNNGKGYGISSYVMGSIESIANSGLIIGTSALSEGIGIYNAPSVTIDAITNTGVIYGKTNAVQNEGGTITNFNNYGILATKGSFVVANSGAISNENNYGLYIEKSTGIVTVDAGKASNDPTEIIVGYAENGDPIKRNMTIKNANIQGGGSGSGTSTDSFVFSGNPTEFNNSILNGKDKTLKVTGADREVKGSIINAYGTAVAFEGADGQLTLSGTTVNGGADEANNITVSGSDNGDTLILQSGEVEYAGGGKGTQNTVINGNIDMKAGDDKLTIEAGTLVNGTLDGGDGSDTLSFNSPVAKEAVNGGINIHHNISGFEKMNINTNVTLFEKTVKDDGTLEDLAITGAENITIGADGILTLRIDISKLGASGDAGKIVGHALYGNTGTIASTGGKLLLAVNGAGNESIISFGGTELDNSLITGSKGNFDTTSKLHTVERLNNKEVVVTARWDLPNYLEYQQLNKIYQGIVSVEDLIGNFNVDNDEKLSTFLGYLNDIYAGNPYSYSSELSRKSAGMFRDIVTENIFKPEANKWMIYGGLTHVDGGTKDTYYGKGYYTYDIGSSDMDADTKITGAYMLGEYGVSDTLTSGVVIGGNKLKSDLSNGSKVEGSALYLGAYAKKYVGNLKVTAGAGFQYGDYDADRLAVNNAASSTGTPGIKYSDNYNDMTYDIYLNGRYSHNIGDNLFLEPYATLSYTYIDQDGADEGNQTLAIETDSKSFDYTVGKVGLDLKKVIPHEKGKSTLSAGVSYTKILDGADEEFITGRFKGGRDFDILVAHKNEHSIGLNAKYALELENGVLFDVKGTYAVERDSHNGAGKNKTKGEWVVGAGLGYKF